MYIHFIVPRLNRAWGLVALRRIARRGVDFRIHGKVHIHFPDKLELGDYVRIGEGSFFLQRRSEDWI
jgi:hypothetical protein